MFFNFFKKRKNDPKKAIKELLDGFELPSFPQAVMNALKKIRDPEASFKAIAKEIEKDPGMHIMVLKFVNSAAFGLSKKISNVTHAVNLLGRSRLESLILPLAVRDALPAIRLSCLNIRQFWYTSALRASLARQLAEELHPAYKDDTFTAALLQDIGIPILLKSKDEKYCSVLNQWDEREGRRLPDIEKERLGYDHQTVGALMAEEWNFPELLQNSILEHHSEKPSQFVPVAVNIVSCVRFLNGSSIEEELSFMKNRCVEEYGLSKHFIDDIVLKAQDEAEEMSAIMQ